MTEKTPEQAIQESIQQRIEANRLEAVALKALQKAAKTKSKKLFSETVFGKAYLKTLKNVSWLFLRMSVKVTDPLDNLYCRTRDKLERPQTYYAFLIAKKARRTLERLVAQKEFLLGHSYKLATIAANMRNEVLQTMDYPEIGSSQKAELTTLAEQLKKEFERFRGPVKQEVLDSMKKLVSETLPALEENPHSLR